MNHADRRPWIDWWKSTKRSQTRVIKTSRAALTAVIENVTSGRQPAHELAYPRESAVQTHGPHDADGATPGRRRGTQDAATPRNS